MQYNETQCNTMQYNDDEGATANRVISIDAPVLTTPAAAAKQGVICQVFQGGFQYKFWGTL